MKHDVSVLGSRVLVAALRSENPVGAVFFSCIGKLSGPSFGDRVGMSIACRREPVKLLQILTSGCHRPFVLAAIRQRFKFGNGVHGVATPALLVIASASPFGCVGKR